MAERQEAAKQGHRIVSEHGGAHTFDLEGVDPRPARPEGAGSWRSQLPPLGANTIAQALGGFLDPDEIDGRPEELHQLRKCFEVNF